MALLSLLTDVTKRVDGRGGGGAARTGHGGGLDVPDASTPGERAGDYLSWIDDDVEVICGGDPAAGGNEGLCFDALLAVARGHNGGGEVCVAGGVVDVGWGP